MGSCACSYDYDSYDPPDIYESKRVKARRQHKCCECHQFINKGETYERVSGLWDGEWSHYKTCHICTLIRDSLAPCAPHGGLRDEISNCYEFDYLVDTEEISV